MTLTIITGTHSFIDLTGKFRNAFMESTQRLMKYNIDGVKFNKRRFDRITIYEDGSVHKEPMRIFPISRSGFVWTITQPTGSCKTVLATELLYRTFLRGGNIEANYSFKWMKQNIGKPKDEWTPSITSIEDVTKARNTRLTIDDIKGTIENWQAKEADIVSMAANLGRKESVDIDITSQGVTNYVPPNIRRIATGYMIPYCTIRDKRVKSPDNKGFPREVEIFSLIPGDTNLGDIFVGFGFLNGDKPDGKLFRPTLELLNSYMSMEHAKGLKVDSDGSGCNSPGWELECEAEEFLQNSFPKLEIKHLKHKIFDLYTPTHAFDVISTDEDGNGYSEHKTWSKHLGAARRSNRLPYLLFKWGTGWGAIRIKSDLPEGQRLNFSDSSIFRRIRTLDGILMPQSIQPPQIISSV